MEKSFCTTTKVEPKGSAICERANSDESEIWNEYPRSVTDIFFLILMTFFLIILCFLLGYCILNGDIFRIINGYDNCGNICGKKTISFGNNSGNCSYSNEKNPFHIVIKRNNTYIKDRYCVKNCSNYSGYRPFFNRCIPNATHKIVDKIISKTGISNFFQEVSEDFHLCYMEIIYLFMISLVISTALLVAFRYLVGYVVWGLLVGVVIACFAATIWLCYLVAQAQGCEMYLKPLGAQLTPSCKNNLMVPKNFNPALNRVSMATVNGIDCLMYSWINIKTDQENTPTASVPVVEGRKKDTHFAFAIVSSVITFLVVLVIWVLRKRVQIVVQLFKESGKAVAAMPPLIILPIMTFVCLATVIALWFFFSLWIESAGILTKMTTGVFHYEKDIWMKIARWKNIFAMLWMAQFLVGCQHMVIAGAVSSWYFTRDKKKLDWPIYHSFRNLVKYHLGSVALGSLVIAIVQFIRILLKFVESKLKGREGSCARSLLKCCQCCLYCFEKILKYLTRNAYIEVAAYGFSFCKGGRQAFRLLVSNALRVAAINSIGDITLFLGKVITVIVTVFIGFKMLQHKEGLQHIWVPLTLAGVFAYFISHCFLTVYEMIIDTIFLCFCEDCDKNDGINRPYYMSRGLMSFVENSKKIIEHQQSKKYLTNVNVQVSPNTEGGEGDRKTD